MVIVITLFMLFDTFEEKKINLIPARFCEM